MLLGAAPYQRRAGSRVPDTARPIAALGHPAPHRVAAEQPPVLAASHGKLEADALIPAEQRQIAVRRGRSDDLEPPLLLELPERVDDVAVDPEKPFLQPAKPGSPE